MSAIEPAPDWYIRGVTLRLLWGESIELPLEPEAEPSNVSDIRAARTMRAVRQMPGRDAFRERPL
jgi:hypothetical protein